MSVNKNSTANIAPSGAIMVSIQQQVLRYSSNGKVFEFAISTAKNGPGEQNNSGCTPRGEHRVRVIIGGGLPANSVFIGRRFTGEIYSAELSEQFPQRDWILTRILWLQGLEVGVNRLGNVDSMRRYIYIHGTPDAEPMGVAKSHGCIRMRNDDVMWLSENIAVNTPVTIIEGPLPTTNLATGERL
ncbi:MAG: L,D-transpeptidase [Oleibacter sp.]|nr:L,D-transpeptidase [Thalassolituus sp.]